MIGHKYRDEIWCDVMPMDICHVLLGRSWQWDRNIIYRDRENIYELKVEGKIVKLYPQVDKIMREKLLSVSQSAYGFESKFASTRNKELWRKRNLRINSFEERENDAGV